MKTQGVLSKGTKLSYKKASEQTFTDLKYMYSVPDLGSEPNQIDITTFDDNMHTYMPGLQDVGGSMSFGFIYDAYDTTDHDQNFKLLKDLEAEVDVITWKITLPDEVTFTFTGRCSAYISGYETDARIDATLSISPATSFVVAYPT